MKLNTGVWKVNWKIFDKSLSQIKLNKLWILSELMDHSGGGLAASSWAAMLGHHPMSGSSNDPGFAHRGSGHYEMPMDLHVPQGFSYYRWETNLN